MKKFSFFPNTKTRPSPKIWSGGSQQTYKQSLRFQSSMSSVLCQNSKDKKCLSNVPFYLKFRSWGKWGLNFGLGKLIRHINNLSKFQSFTTSPTSTPLSQNTLNKKNTWIHQAYQQPLSVSRLYVISLMPKMPRQKLFDRKKK